MKKVLFSVLFIVLFAGLSFSADFKILIMQDDKGAAEKYKPLMDYLKTKDINVNLVGTPNYQSAAKMFSAGEADAMFSGSGVAGIMIIKDVAYPVLRPVSKDGISTYHAVILGQKSAQKFDGTAKFFDGKKVIFSALASSGEIFYHSIPGIKNIKANVMIAANHGAAIDALSRGAADYAIVKNLVWEKNKDKYPNIEKIGEDKGENPDMTLIVSKKTKKDLVDKISNILLNIKNDNSPSANEVKNQMNIQGFIKTTQKDFSHTLGLLQKAGVKKDFDFKF
ncbi:MAG: phosphate/phosphite/phosphonate ABC transporter substrate-binding protein [Proteobacteria bacterium]|nr:phosphate/phosphite/phosphonate ABC transporter substrate-binding protein [Pseudomonadota bacterium]